MNKFAVILPAAGRSQRFGKQGPKKVFSNLDGRPVWLRAADLFLNRSDVVQVIVVISPDDQQYFQDRFGSDLAVLGIDWALGGSERYHSVANALEKVDSRADFIAVHDAARPCTTEGDVEQVFAAAVKYGAAILATPLASTIKRGRETIEATVDRSHLWAAHTPQVFRRDWLESAYAELLAGQAESNRTQTTDDAQVIENAGHAVHLVPGKSTNLKITTKEDLQLAQAILKSRPKSIDSLFHPFKDG